MPKRNAFWFFMREMMDELRNDGVEISSFAEMPGHAGPKWSLLSPEERRPYEQMVKSDAADLEGTRSKGKMNNQRELISEQEWKDREKERRELAREEEVQSLRHRWPPGNGVIDERFLLLFFEYFVKTHEEEYHPCEVAVIEFSLKEGIIRKFHSFIDPGPCPKGFMYEERLRSEQRHQIPCCDRFNIPQFSKEQRNAFKNHARILQQIVDFCSCGGTVLNPRAFTFGDDIEMVISCLDFLHEKAKGRASFAKTALPRILPLEHLLPQFYLHSDEVIGSCPSVSSMQRVLTQSVWDYESGIRCDFHDDVETRFCALGQLYRWSFAIFDAMKAPLLQQEKKGKIVSVFDFTLTEKHLPATSKASFTLLNPADLIDREYRKAISSATSLAGASAATAPSEAASTASESTAAALPPHDLRASFRRDALKFTEGGKKANVPEDAATVGVEDFGSSAATWHDKGASAVSSPKADPRVASSTSTNSFGSDSASPLSPPPPLSRRPDVTTTTTTTTKTNPLAIEKKNYLGRGFGLKSLFVAQPRVSSVGAAASAAAPAGLSFGRGRGCAVSRRSD